MQWRHKEKRLHNFHFHRFPPEKFTSIHFYSIQFKSKRRKDLMGVKMANWLLRSWTIQAEHRFLLFFFLFVICLLFVNDDADDWPLNQLNLTSNVLVNCCSEWWNHIDDLTPNSSKFKEFLRLLFGCFFRFVNRLEQFIFFSFSPIGCFL